MINGRVHHFGVVGLTNGMAVLADRETRTHWDHITGAATSGPLAGHRLEAWPVQMTTVAAARIEDPEIGVIFSGHRSPRQALAGLLYGRFIDTPGWIPGFFYGSLSEPMDSRLDKLAQGLGVVVGQIAKFYPVDRVPSDGLRDPWPGGVLYVEQGPIDRVPRARWLHSGEQPMQLLSRWYGFSYTYPGCEIYQP